MASSRSSSSPRPPSPLHPVSSLAPRSPFRQPPRRSTSPSLSALPKHLQPLTKRLEGNDAEAETRVSAGTLSEAEYERLLPKWRVWVRRKLVRSLEREMPYLEWMQKTLRTPRRDVYFVQSSLLGTHSAFLIFLPMTFWFGGGETGRGLLYVLAAGGYVTSVLKDCFCVPRPYAPPLHRLSVGNHSLEYGFPSTHSTNSVSLALYFGELLMRWSPEHTALNAVIHVALFLFALTITFGRVYTGMHSIVDVVAGSVIGVLIWVGYWFSESAIEAYTLTPSWLVTATYVPATLFLVFVHPAPAEDCPCFEDAVAFLSVAAGILVGRNWCTTNWTQATLGAEWETPLQQSVWAAAVLAKLVVGVLAIFTWRLVAKEVAHATLPPVFRFCSPFILPRRHYVVATEYDTYKKTDGLHPIPSILDLPSLEELEGEIDVCETSATADAAYRSELRNRNGTIAEDVLEKAKDEVRSGHGASRRVEDGESIRRDADVLTKVIVYSGIGWIASIGMPWVFMRIGLSV